MLLSCSGFTCLTLIWFLRRVQSGQTVFLAFCSLLKRKKWERRSEDGGQLQWKAFFRTVLGRESERQRQKERKREKGVTGV